jgi:hypothetical protein
MKPLNYLITLFVIFCAYVFSGCSSTRIVTMNATQPAEITFPSYVNTLLVLDRTRFENSTASTIEGILTGELPQEDKAGLQELINSFQQTIAASPRFEIRNASESLEGNSMGSAFPDALPWSKIEELCKRYNTEAVISIEIFDTDFIVTDGKRKVKKEIEENGVKKEIEVNEFFAKGIGNLTIGLRIYDPKSKKMIDQQLVKKSNTWQATGSSVGEAIEHLVRKAEATRYVSNLAGVDYAYKIAPMPVKISRQFYSKSKTSSAIIEGSRRADMNDWKSAVRIWEIGVKNANGKDAGRLCYNLAVGYEVLGELETAKMWISRAYVEYKNKQSKSYASLLDDRMYDEDIVQQQMK